MSERDQWRKVEQKTEQNVETNIYIKDVYVSFPTNEDCVQFNNWMQSLSAEDYKRFFYKEKRKKQAISFLVKLVNHWVFVVTIGLHLGFLLFSLMNLAFLGIAPTFVGYIMTMAFGYSVSFLLHKFEIV